MEFGSGTRPRDYQEKDHREAAPFPDSARPNSHSVRVRDDDRRMLSRPTRCLPTSSTLLAFWRKS